LFARLATDATDELTAMQIPKRLYSLEELRLNNLRPEEFLSPEDKTLNSVRTILQVQGLATYNLLLLQIVCYEFGAN